MNPNHFLITPPFTQAGDRVRIVSTARKVQAAELQTAISLFESKGYKVSLGRNIFALNNQFAGSDDERLSDLQEAIDDPDIQIIMCARGGYGTIRLIDKIDFSALLSQPKWICGFSDVCVLHAHINNVLKIKTMHCSMPVTFPKNTASALETLFACLEGSFPLYSADYHSLNRRGVAKGIIFGGNLSILNSLSGSKSFPNFENGILFIEDLDEYLYHIDRMMMNLKRTGLLSTLSGLIVGGMTEMRDNEVPFGKTPEEIIIDNVSDYNYPVVFNFPSGHIADNQAIVLGAEVELKSEEAGTSLCYI